MALALPDPYVGGDFAKDLTKLSDEEFRKEMKERFDMLQRNLEKLARQWPIHPNSMIEAPACRVRPTTNQTVATATNTTITFGETVHERGGTMWDSGSPTLLTVEVPGLYHVGGRVEWGAAAGGYRIVALLKNGAAVAGTIDDPLTAVQRLMHEVTTDVYLDVDDTLSLYVYQTSGGDVAVVSADGVTPALSADDATTALWTHWISP